jgi:hypothetical protein
MTRLKAALYNLGSQIFQQITNRREPIMALRQFLRLIDTHFEAVQRLFNMPDKMFNAES